MVCALALIPPLTTQAAPPPAPSAGTILQQTRPPAQLPTTPAPVLELPPAAQPGPGSTVSFTVNQIVLKGNTLIPTKALEPLVTPLQGHKESLTDIRKVASRITTYYQQHGYPLAYAYLPAQKVRNGVVTLQIVEPRYDRINIVGSPKPDIPLRFNKDQARRTLGVQPGEPVEQKPLSRGLLLLSQTPGIRVAGTLIPGHQPGTTTLEASVTDTPVIGLNAGIDDYGSNYTGRVRYRAGASLNDPFGYGSRFAVNGLVSQGNLLQSVAGSFLSPNLYDGLRLNVYGSHTTYALGGPFAVLQQHGVADQFGIGLTAPLIVAPGRILQARLDLLRDRFKQDSTLTGLYDPSRLYLERLNIDGSLSDHFGGTTSAGVLVTHGTKLIDTAVNRMLDASGPHTQGSFWLAQARLQRHQTLPWRFTLAASLSGQVSSSNLDGSQKFYLGGPGGVMSAAVGEAGGDQGVLARLRLSHVIPVPIPGQLAGSVLLQGGEVWLNHSPYPGAANPNKVGLAGSGVGLSYQWSRHLNFQFDYVHRLGGSPSNSGLNPHGQLWLSLQINT